MLEARILIWLPPRYDLEPARKRRLGLGINPTIIRQTAQQTGAIFFDPISHPYLHVTIEWRVTRGFPLAHEIRDLGWKPPS